MPPPTKNMSHVKVNGHKKEIIHGKKHDPKLFKRLQFEMMISSLSTSFINVSDESIDQVIESGLRRVVEFIGFDRASLIQEKNNRQLELTHHWTRLDSIPPPNMYDYGERYPLLVDYMRSNKKSICLSALEEAPQDIAQDLIKLMDLGMKSILLVPLMVGGTFLGYLSTGSFIKTQSITDILVHRFRLVGEIFANALMRKMAAKKLSGAFIEIKDLKDQLEAECTYLREEIKLEHNFSNVVGASPAMKNVLRQVEQVAGTETTVLIQGETGTGKEVVSRSLHNVSLRGNRPLIKVDCASLPANLIENELFGHEKGAFTGADKKKIGRLELADGSTVFLDEIGELPIELQSKMLRVIQENAFERLGGTRTIKVDIRIIAATNRDLNEEVRKGTFREDLWYRLDVFPIHIPPLRDRKEDIPLLVESIVRQCNKKLGKKIEKISNTAIEILQNYNWPGNIRELENVITRAVITTSGNLLRVESFKALQDLSVTLTEPCETLSDIEREHILRVLRKANWKIQGPHGAAEILGLKPTTLRDRMKKRMIQRPTTM